MEKHAKKLIKDLDLTPHRDKRNSNTVYLVKEIIEKLTVEKRKIVKIKKPSNKNNFNSKEKNPYI